jgi:hypothetical protein
MGNTFYPPLSPPFLDFGNWTLSLFDREGGNTYQKDAINMACRICGAPGDQDPCKDCKPGLDKRTGELTRHLKEVRRMVGRAELLKLQRKETVIC